MCQKIELLGIPLFGYGFMILLGFLSASYLCRKEAERRGISKEKIVDLLVFLVLTGIIGSRIYYVIRYYDEFFKHAPWYKVFAIWEGGLIFYGGFVAAFLAGWWYLKRHKLPILRVLDTCAPFLPLGMAFGRIGCWLNGCCWGWRCTDFLPSFFNRFPPGSPVYYSHSQLGYLKEGVERTLPVQPAQLYDSMHSFMIFAFLWWFLRKKPPDGYVTLLFVLMYGLGRFVMEMLRGDYHLVFNDLTASQNISLGMVASGIVGIYVLTYKIRKNAKTES